MAKHAGSAILIGPRATVELMIIFKDGPAA